MYGAIVLCGGESSRMGRDKSSLPFGPHATLLERVVGILQQVVPAEAIVVVAGRRQRVPPLAAGVTVIHESSEGRGPLVALIEGLERLPPGVQTAFVSGCDTPLLQPAFVRRILDLANGEVDAVVPVDADRIYPLAAAYATMCLPLLCAATKVGERSLRGALRHAQFTLCEAPVNELRDADPDLKSLVNCNTPEEYERVLRMAHGSPAE